MESGIRKLRLPRLIKATLRGFSLYSLEPVVSVVFPDGVFCLVGANGLGKSTFLSALNYAITGVVPEPDRRFESVAEYYRDTMEFSKTFYNGRISESDRLEAEVSIEFRVGRNTYEITRGLFEPSELRALAIYRDDDRSEAILHTETLDSIGRNEAYKSQLASDIGVETFQQFVFLQYFVLTFDERRHLLFWDTRVLEQALYLAFGLDPTDARVADNLRRDIERADSRVRNANWNASSIRRTMEEIRAAAISANSDDQSTTDIQETYDRLTQQAMKCTERVQALEDQQRDANLRLAEASAKHASLRLEYSAIFEQRITARIDFRQHPVLRSSIADNRCAICGSQDNAVSERINSAIIANICPLCGTNHENDRLDPQHITRLQQLDLEMVETRRQLDTLAATLTRLTSENEIASLERERSQSQLQEFESANRDKVLRSQDVVASASTVDAILQPYRIQLENALNQKDKSYATREEKKRQLQPLQQKLAAAYLMAETEFVPIFRSLAHSFLGLDLDIRLESTSVRGVNLVLDVRSTPRRQEHQLSESQRFFLDIALRMALAQHSSADDSKASVFIDTPEGSLDVAYESRAGTMFAQFIREGFHIIMTANLNGSRLLTSLATQAGEEHMTVCRMTSWAELSDVQQSEEHLFDEVYSGLVSALHGPIH